MLKVRDKITNIQLLRRAENENLPNNCENLDINNFSIPHGKMIFMFGGNTTNRPEAANGNAKIIRSLMDDDHANIPVYSFTYQSEPYNSRGVMGKEYEKDAHLLFEKVFKPLIYDKNGHIKEAKGIERAFQKIVLAAHCGGCGFINIIVNEYYKLLKEKFPENTAEILINKIQYYAYAPHAMLEHNVNAFIITPLFDSTYTWSNALDIANSHKVDIDYPKGAIKRLLKAKQHGTFQETMNKEFVDTRGIMFKVGNSTFLIPHRMNPNTSVGDHSIECVGKTKFLNSGTDLANTAKVANYASKRFINEFLSNDQIDIKGIFSDITDMLDLVPNSPYSI